MATTTRIKLAGPDNKVLDNICQEIVNISKTAGAKYAGPIPLPTKKLRVAVRKSPCGGGTETYEHHEMRIHKRMVDVSADESTLRQIMRIPTPRNVQITIELKA